MNIRDEVILPVVEVLGGGHAAAELLFATGLAESGYRVRRQHGGGPALGFWQMEPATHDDIWKNYLTYRPELAGQVREFLEEWEPANYAVLALNDKYACAMCRIHYMRVPAPLPPPGELPSQAAYWKEHYNTCKGKGSVEHFLAALEGASHNAQVA